MVKVKLKNVAYVEKFLFRIRASKVMTDAIFSERIVSIKLIAKLNCYLPALCLKCN